MKPRTIPGNAMAVPLAQGREFWRSLDELSQTPEFIEYLHREFPVGASEWRNDLSRRTFLKGMAASFALAGLSACTPAPREKIIPYVQAPEEVVPGIPLFYATALDHNGYGIGVLAESHMGRPTKIEGNPEHPSSLGATTAFMQSDLLMLYDPDRSQNLLFNGRPTNWGAFTRDMHQLLVRQRENEGAGVRLLTGRVTSPTLAAQIMRFLDLHPRAQWHHWDAMNEDNARRGAIIAFGRDVQTHYRISRAKVIVSLDGDFLGSGPEQIRLAREWADGRRVRHDHIEMNRVYMAECTPTITGACADHRIAVKPSQIASCAHALAATLGIGGSENPAAQSEWIALAARDLQQHRGDSLVIAGEFAPPEVHALCHVMNARLGNAGSTVEYIEPVEVGREDNAESLASLVEQMRAGEVSSLFILGTNPVYSAPSDLLFAEAMKNVSSIIHHGYYLDETARLCTWHVPSPHALEDWSDIRAADGTASIVQPLIEPLYNSHSAHELLAAMIDPTAIAYSYEVVRGYWRESGRFSGEFESAWQKAVHDGIIRDTASPLAAVEADESFLSESQVPASNDQIDVCIRPDPTIHDGKYSNIGWQQELPKPLTKLVWDNAAMMSAATAQSLGVLTGDHVRVTANDAEIEAPALIVPGHADEAITLTLGYGRLGIGNVANRIGYNAYKLRTREQQWLLRDAIVERGSGFTQLVVTQDHHSMEGRPIAVHASLKQFAEHPHELAHFHHGQVAVSFYPEEEMSPYEWGMAVDLTVCIGCNACVVACQAENNIPVVGKKQVANGREMHWLRIDRYYRGPVEKPETYFQPMLCMHCEKAPCEVVCPVAATSHSAEGLNEMTYNRCVGTRYCSNNCPYKVRRFNFLEYNQIDHAAIAASKNPDVTIRTRGVMEKCTYCVQRINEARRDAKRRGTPIQDGEIQTACQQACPTRTFVFGNIADAKSEVIAWKREPHNYGVLEELNTQPRTSYLAAIRNPATDEAPHSDENGHA